MKLFTKEALGSEENHARLAEIHAAREEQRIQEAKREAGLGRNALHAADVHLPPDFPLVQKGRLELEPGEADLAAETIRISVEDLSNPPQEITVRRLAPTEITP